MIRKLKRPISVVLLMAVCMLTVPIMSSAAFSNVSYSTATQITFGTNVSLSGMSSGQTLYWKFTLDTYDLAYICLFDMPTGADYDMKLYCLEGGVYYLVDTAQQSGNANEYLYMELPDNHMYVSLTYFIEVRATSAPSTGDTTKLKVINTRMITEYSANSNYNRTAARTYAYTYYNSRNPAYYSWPQDCANFVSQCLEAGGMAQIEGAWNSNSAWLHEKEPLNYSLTWSGANSFAKHWGTDATGEGYARGYECRYYLVKDAKANYLDLYDTVQIGDVIIKCNDSNPVSGQHAMIVCDKMLMDESITLAAHTEDTRTADLYTYLYQSQYEDEVIIIIRIKREA